MLKTLLASTVLAGAIFVAAHAQEAPAPDVILPAPDAGAEAPAPMDEGLVEDWAAVAIESVAAEELDGAEIRTFVDDERVATVGETVIGTDGSVVGVVARFGGFLGFGREQVMLAAEEIEIFKDPDGRVLIRTNLTREALEALPEYEG
jgi:hypothetical protein